MFFCGMSVMGLALGWVKPVFFEAFEHMGDCSFVYRDVLKEWKGMKGGVYGREVLVGNTIPCSSSALHLPVFERIF